MKPALLLYLALAGAAGAWSRLLIGEIPLLATTDEQFPLTTLFCNLLGSFLLALFVATFATRLSETFRIVIATGFFGAFTTFSTLNVDLLSLLESGRYSAATLYFFVSLLGGLLLVWCGFRISRWRVAGTNP